MHVRCFQVLHVVCRGYQYKAGFLDGIKREVITIYEILRDSANNLLWAVPDYQFTCAPFHLLLQSPWLALLKLQYTCEILQACHVSCWSPIIARLSCAGAQRPAGLCVLRDLLY